MAHKAIEILYVEDNPGDVELTRDAFTDAKIRNNIHVAEDGQTALDFIFKRNGHEEAPTPDLILLDLNLPKVDGKEVLSVIKNDESVQAIPVVVLTSSEAEADVVKSYQLHANCYVTKPVDLDSFLDVVRTIESFWLTVVKLPN